MITSSQISELTKIERELRDIAKRAEDPEIKQQMEAFDRVIDRMADSWSGSHMGYHTHVYYSGFQRPVPGDRFNTEWGLDESSDHWVEHNPNDVFHYIYAQAGCGEIKELIALHEGISRDINRRKSSLESIVEVCLANAGSGFTDKLRERVNGCGILTAYEILHGWLSETQATRDQRVRFDSISPPPHLTVRPHVGDLGKAYAKLNPPPHLEVRSYVDALRSAFKLAGDLADLTVELRNHVRRHESVSHAETQNTATEVFIGHGRSGVWRELKEFLVGRLGLEVEEFNSESQAGRTTVHRLEEMLGNSCVALLVFTGEDLHEDGATHARENVVHEAGLFQGRLGFQKAIVLLEDGCAEFSNIVGLQQIRFPKGNIRACFEDVRMVLEREKVIAGS